MTITEKIPHSSPCEVKFHKEGVFWVAYEQSAYHIHQQKGYRATKKLIKTLGQEIVSIGFPQSSYENFLRTTTSVLEQDEPLIKVFSLDKTIDMEVFRQWKAGLPLSPARHCESETRNSPVDFEPELPLPPACHVDREAVPGFTVRTVPFAMTVSTQEEVFQKVRDFPLENKTPMDCMLFLSGLKKIYYTHGSFI